MNPALYRHLTASLVTYLGDEICVFWSTTIFFMNPESKRKAQKDFVSCTKPSQLMQISLELESW